MQNWLNKDSQSKRQALHVFVIHRYTMAPTLQNIKLVLGMVAHAHDPRTQEVKARGS
jgi:hypothetical protein